MQSTDQRALKLELLEKYKAYIRETGNVDENYKWDAIEHFRKHWDPDAEDFLEMFAEAFRKQYNLMFHNSFGVIKDLIKFSPDEIKLLFKKLYDEDIELEKHLLGFKETIEDIMPRIIQFRGVEKMNHYQDERALSVYLAFRYPEKYYLFKNSYYKLYCEYLGIDSVSAGKKYLHFTVLADELKKHYIENDTELLELHKALHLNIDWNDTNLITQNLLYRVLTFVGEGDQNITKMLEKFSEVADDWFNNLGFMETRHEFFKAFKNKEQLQNADWEYFQQVGKHLNTFQSNPLARANALGRINPAKGSTSDALLNYRENFIDLIYGNASIDKRIDKFIANVPYFSDSTVSELVGQFFADKYVFFNKKDKDGIDALGIKPGFNRGDSFGTKFLKFNKAIEPLLKMYDEIVGQRTTTTVPLEVDQFLWFAATQKSEAINNEAQNENSVVQEPATVYDSENTNYYWLNASPKIWSLDQLELNPEIDYTTHTETGSKRRIYKYMQAVKQGDKVIGYETTPVKKVRALMEVTKSIYENETGEEVFDMKLVAFTPQQPSWDDLKGLQALENSEVFRNNQGSLFKLTKEEYEAIVELTLTKPEFASYSKDDLLSDVFISPEKLDRALALLRRKKNLILQGPPGTGKTYFAKRLAYCLMGEKDISRVRMIQFHQSYAYEDFIQGYRPEDGKLKLKNGVFYEFAKQASRDQDRDYVMIIDEINRGNLSKIFGELMLLIEADKRDEKIKLAYAREGEEFSVPKNLHIIGTMNTADRSLALVDYALRRRFAFIDMYPHFGESFIDNLQLSGHNQDFILNLIKMINNTNQLIAGDPALGKGFQIGHSYFVSSHFPVNPDEWLHDIFNFELLPLLEEYWFDNEERINEAKGYLKIES